MAKSKEILINCQGSRYMPYTDMQTFQGNLKTLSDKNLKKLKAMILKHGWIAPVFMWEGKILDGHGRLQALKALIEEGCTIKDLPVVDIFASTEKSAANILLAINSQYNTMTNEGLSEFANRFDFKFNDLSCEFEFPTIDYDIVAGLQPRLNNEEGDDDIPELTIESSTTQPGDIYQVGPHRIACGDSTDKELRDRLLGEAMPDLILTDPPYGVNIVNKKGTVGAKRSHKSCLYPLNIYRKMIGDNKIFDPTFMFEYGCHKILFGANYYSHKLPPSPCWLVWYKMQGGNRNDFADAELAWTDFTSPTRLYDHLWSGMRRKGNRKDELMNRIHPTQKPVGLLADILNDYSKRNDIVVDFYLGSGSTLIAAEKTGRICYGIEIDPLYVDTIISRICKYLNTYDMRKNGDNIIWIPQQ